MTHILAYPRRSCGHLLSADIVPFREAAAPPDHVWRERETLENDENYLQVIAYAVLIHSTTAWAYRRVGGDARLDGRRSIGVGGHVDQCDAKGDPLATARTALKRELAEELLHPPEIPDEPIAWINEQLSPVGRVHLGLLWAIPCPCDYCPQVAHGEKLAGEGFLPLAEVTRNQGFEHWSELAARAVTNAAS